MQIKQQITAQNCTVEFRGKEIGYLQNLTIDAQYNLIPFKNLHQFNIQHYAQGIATYTATAQRAFVDITDTILGNQTSVLELAQLAKAASKPANTAEDQMARLINDGMLFVKGIGFVTNALEDLQKVSQNASTDDKDIGDLFAFYDYFDIALRNPIINIPQVFGDAPASIIDKIIGSQTNIMILRNCKFASRSITVTPSNIAVMEGINIQALSLNEYANKPDTRSAVDTTLQGVDAIAGAASNLASQALNGFTSLFK